MNTKHKHPRRHKIMNGEHKWPWLVFAVVCAAVAATGLYYFLNVHNHPAATTTNQNQKPPQYAFAATPYAGFPTNVVPTSSAVVKTEYWEGENGGTGTGGVFIMNEPIAQAVPDLKAQYAAGGWSITNPASSTASTEFYITNSVTGSSLSVNMIPDPNPAMTKTETVVMVSIAK